ncbi:MAG: DEAD/DEAH box helicase [Deltaproteobacteria bacterium]|nr:DEAD/DEAH box helicase [Deltaproteobacteria bacterium]
MSISSLEVTSPYEQIAATRGMPAGPAREPRIEESEAYRLLFDLARRRTGSIDTDLVVRHVLAVTEGADWPVRRAAMEALLRRFGFAKRDGLRIRERPPQKAVFGLYTTQRKGSDARPYFTLLTSYDLPAGSCDCPDFQRSSLGLCKHLLAVLEEIAASAPRVERARAEQRRADPQRGHRLRWDPVRPLTGAGDWLERLIWQPSAVRHKVAEREQRAARWFQDDTQGRRHVADGCVADRDRRTRIIDDVLAFAVSDERSDQGATVEPALWALLHAEQERLGRAGASAISGDDVRRALRGLKRKLYPYQLAGVQRFFEVGRLLLADDMGLGKTAQAIAVCHALWTLGKVRRGLLVVPASLKPQWRREWQAFSEVPITLVEGSPRERRSLYRTQRKGFFLINYEQVLRDLELLHGLRPQLVVLDEAQRIKNWATKTAVYVKQLDPVYRLVLTGTPMENRLDELASILDWVDDTALEPKWRLAPLHSVHADGTREVVGARHLDTLRTRLKPCMVRRVRREVLDQLPPRTDTRIPVELTAEQRDEHDAFDTPIRSLLARARKRPLTQAEFLKLMSMLTMQRIFCNGLAQARFDEVWPTLERIGRPTDAVLQGLHAPKLYELRELVAQLAVEQQRKIVIFSQWRRMLRLADWAVSDLLADAGLRAVFFSGDEGQKRRDQNIVDFHDDPRTCILFATDAGGVGLNLQRAASCCINVELPWNPAVLEQRIGRIYRLGQEHPIEVYNLVCEEGIESRIANLVADKRALFCGLFDGTSDAIRFERSGSFLSQLEKIVEPVKVPDLPEDVDADTDGSATGGESAEARALEDTIATAAPEIAAGEIAAARSPEPATAAPTPDSPTAAASNAARATVTAEQVRDLFSQIQVRPAADGKVALEAPAEAAAALAALLSGMGTLLASLQRPT